MIDLKLFFARREMRDYRRRRRPVRPEVVYGTPPGAYEYVALAPVSRVPPDPSGRADASRSAAPPG